MEEREITLEQESSKELEIELIREGGSSGGAREVHIGTNEPTGEDIVLWIDPNGETDPIPTKTSELENDSGFITAPKISEITYSATGINISNNTVHRFTNVMSSLSLALPTEIDKLFQSEVVFKSGTTATSLTYDNSVKWSGDDITDNKFVPVANKTYNIIFWYDGFYMNAVVRGV